MPNSYKILGQAFPSPNATANLYTVPANTSAIISTLNVCNQNSTNVTFRAAVQKAGAGLDRSHFIVFESAIPAQDSISLSLGMTLGNTDVLSVVSFQGNVSFNAFGTEIS